MEGALKLARVAARKGDTTTKTRIIALEGSFPWANVRRIVDHASAKIS